MLRLRLSVLGALAVSLGLSPSVAEAELYDETAGAAGELTADGAAAEAWTGSDASSATTESAKTAPTVQCEYHRFDGGYGGIGKGEPATDVQPGDIVVRTCHTIATGRPTSAPTIVTISAPAEINPVPGLIDRARAELTLPTPTISRNPPGSETLPYIDTWFWTGVDTTTSDASGNAVSVTVTATPADVTFAGDGQSVTCPDGGSAYDPDASADSQASECVLRFQPPTHDVTVTAEATWSLTWQASTGESGDLGTATSTASTTFSVAKYATVIRG